jgi:hypothetical protein
MLAKHRPRRVLYALDSWRKSKIKSVSASSDAFSLITRKRVAVRNHAAGLNHLDDHEGRSLSVL